MEISSNKPFPNFLGIEWGASQEKAKSEMLGKEAVIFDEERSGSKNLVFVGGLFANKEVRMWVLQFADAGLHTAKILIVPPQTISTREFDDLNARLNREYGSPARSTPETKLYSFGSEGELEGSILCQLKQGGIRTTYQHQKLNKQAISQMSGLNAPMQGTLNTSRQGACFIATATLGDYDHPDVLELRRFRDEVLLPRAVGRTFVRTYYKLSPPLADFIKVRPRLRKLARRVLVRPLVHLVKGR